jgi:hypothetical protein
MQPAILLLTIGIALTVVANPLPDCGWEYCEQTVLGLWGPGAPPIEATIASAPDPVLDGQHSLRLVQNSPAGTSRAYLAYVSGIGNGAHVTLEMARYDPTPGAPSCRIRGRYNDSLPGNLDADDGDAGGPADPPDAGWQWISHTWVMSGDHSGLVIDIELLGEPGDAVWLDDMVIVPPSSCTLAMPCFIVVPSERHSFGEVKQLFD